MIGHTCKVCQTVATVQSRPALVGFEGGAISNVRFRKAQEWTDCFRTVRYDGRNGMPAGPMNI